MWDSKILVFEVIKIVLKIVVIMVFIFVLFVLSVSLVLIMGFKKLKLVFWMESKFELIGLKVWIWMKDDKFEVNSDMLMMVLVWLVGILRDW